MKRETSRDLKQDHTLAFSFSNYGLKIEKDLHETKIRLLSNSTFQV